MTSILTRRSLLRGLIAAPAIVAASSLMPLRGTKLAFAQDFPGLQILFGYVYVRPGWIDVQHMFNVAKSSYIETKANDILSHKNDFDFFHGTQWAPCAAGVVE